MSKASSTMNKETTQSEPSSMAESVSIAAHEAIDQATPKLAKLESRLRTSSAATSATIKERAELAKEKFNVGVHKSRVFARKNPLLTLGAAFTAGALVAAVISKRKS